MSTTIVLFHSLINDDQTKLDMMWRIIKASGQSQNLYIQTINPNQDEFKILTNQMEKDIDEQSLAKDKQGSKMSDISDEFFKKCQDLQIIQKPFHLDEIYNEVQNRDTDSQFQLLRALTQTKKHKLRFRLNNAIQNKKNRYPEQSIYDHSRVILPKASSNLNKNGQGYINANYIKHIQKDYRESSTQSSNKLIITQGPVQNTTDELMQMIKAENIQCLVMLCRLVENGKNRCADYLSKHKKELIQKIADGSIQVSKITIVDNSDDSYSFIHVAYSQWPDKSVPSQIGHIYELIKYIIRFDKIAVHCSAGLGRSGVVAAILMVQKNEQWINKNKLSVFRQVRKMRQCRFGAVQNSQQYGFIYKYFKYISKAKRRDQD